MRLVIAAAALVGCLLARSAFADSGEDTGRCRDSTSAGGVIQRNWLVWALVIAALFGSGAGAQKTAKDQQPEQTNFGSEPVPGEIFINRPVEIPEAALQVLRSSQRVLRCLSMEGIAADQVPAGWFVGSEIHLNGEDETDLVVLPNVPKIVAYEFPPSLNGGCLLGAHTGPFWVLRSTGSKYELLLETDAEVLEVLNSRTKGNRDIKEVTGFIGTVVSETFGFDGEKYQPSEHQEK